LVSSVQRPGTKPVIQAADSQKAYARLLLESAAAAQASAAREGGLAAIICADRESLQNVIRILEKGQAKYEVLKSSSQLPERGLVVLKLSLAKGLEFDRVILPDADAAHYPSDTLSRHCLYTAISRATREITLLADGTLSPLLENITSCAQAVNP
ncbi:MAG: ATP-binding domain-containing protein, partial [Lachnospiraceae bacterium]|nr:ATP-binding domain-containing protein [Lachnospiraceae bacterium]